jgi:hypothetical protein
MFWESSDYSPGICYPCLGPISSTITPGACGLLPSPFGDFDADGRAEVVVMEAPLVRIADAITGAVEGTITLPQSWWGQVEVIPRAAAIDLDSDFYPEIVMFNLAGYMAVIDHVGVAGAPTPAPQANAPNLSIRPNPFNPSATIEYMVPKVGVVGVKVFDVSGRLVRKLMEERLEAGTHTARWDGRDDSGHQLPSGSYFYELSIDGQVLDKGKGVLLK